MNDPREWHLDRRLQITHILSTLALGVSAVLYVGDIRKDVEVLRMQQQQQADRDHRQDNAVEAMKADQNTRLTRMEDKLDRLIEYTRAKR